VEIVKAYRSALASGLILIVGCAGPSAPPLPMTADVEQLSYEVWYRCRGPGIQNLRAGWMRPGVLHIQGVLSDEWTRADLLYCIQRIAGVTEVVDQTTVIGPAGGRFRMKH